MSSIRLACFLAICSAIAAPAASAATERQAAALILAEGAVYLDDELVVALSSAVVLHDSATVRTAGGRAIVALKHGGVLALDEHTRVRVLANGVYNFNRVEILEGTAVVISDTSSPLVSCLSDTRLSSDGIFRFDVQRTRPNGTAVCRFRVYDGAAAVPLPSVIAVLRSGQAMGLDPTCGDMIPTTNFAPEQMDDFDRWSRQHTIRP
jgi:ferric-dicitrate binding protein FerR (iron transport regulator)